MFLPLAMSSPPFGVSTIDQAPIRVKAAEPQRAAVAPRTVPCATRRQRRATTSVVRELPRVAASAERLFRIADAPPRVPPEQAGGPDRCLPEAVGQPVEGNGQPLAARRLGTEQRE